MDALRMLTQEELDRGVAGLSKDQQTYFKLLISHLVRSFSDPDYSCVIVVGVQSRGTVSVCSVNADEHCSAGMMAHALDVVTFADTVGVPTKGEFH